MAGVDFDRLRAEMRSSRRIRRADLPTGFQHIDAARQPLVAPLVVVPINTLVSMKIEVPDNHDGKFYALGWRCDRAGGLPVDDARAEICELLVDTFLNLTMPLPR